MNKASTTPAPRHRNTSKRGNRKGSLRATAERRPLPPRDQGSYAVLPDDSLFRVGVTDSFCGAGGSSTGLARACEELGIEYELLAMNHWDVAIATHSANHPQAEHRQVNLETATAADTRAKWPVDISWFSPSCPEHSYAKGGASIDEQKRAHPWIVVRMVGEEMPRVVIVENVSNIRAWGPCETLPDGRRRPIKSRRGETYRAWWAAMESMGYVGREAILNAKDFGAPQDRPRWFAIFRRDGLPIEFPTETHGAPGSPEVVAGQKLPHVGANEILDFTIQGESVVRGSTPLAPPTLARVFYGCRKLWGDAATSLFAPRLLVAARRGLKYQRKRLPRVRAATLLARTFSKFKKATASVARCEKAIARYGQLVGELETFLSAPREIGSADLAPLLVALRGTSSDALRRTAGSVESPAPPVLANGNHLAVATPVVRTVVGANRTNNVPHEATAPTPPLTTSTGGGLYVAQASATILGQQGGSVLRPIWQPMQTIAANGYLRLFAAAIVDVRGGQKPKRVRAGNEQLGAVTTHNGAGVLKFSLAPCSNQTGWRKAAGPLVVSRGSVKDGQQNVNRTRTVEVPFPAATASGTGYLATPAIVAIGQSPSGTVVEIDGELYLLDLLFRMIEPHELQLTQGFGADYLFTGTKHDVTAQIGNAVEVKTATAIYRVVLSSFVRARDSEDVAA